MNLRYFYIATSTGPITVWKMENTKRLIHTFNGHFKRVTCLVPLLREEEQFISASLDGTAKIWSLDKFNELYSLSFDGGVLDFVRIIENGQRVILSDGIKV